MVNASLLEVLHAGLFLLAASWVYSTLNRQLNPNNIATIFGSFYRIYGENHEVTKYIFDKLYDWFGFNKETILSFLGTQLENTFYSTHYLKRR